MNNFLIVSFVSLFLAACSLPSSEPQSQASQPSTTPEIQTAVKKFQPNAQDAADIEILATFNQNFIDMSKEMRHEIDQLKAQNNLRSDFLQQRKRDQALSALNMLKDLELNTPQGHYIQGMLYDYWDQQLKFLDGKQATAPSKDITLQAEQQLDYWRAQMKKA